MYTGTNDKSVNTLRQGHRCFPHLQVSIRRLLGAPDSQNWLDPNNNDDRIIANALELQINKPSDNVIFVSADINFQNKAELANLTIYDTDDLE